MVPVASSARMPSPQVPTSSGRLWKRTTNVSLNWLRNSRFSIICADMLTSTRVCCCARSDSPEASNTATNSPR